MNELIEKIYGDSIMEKTYRFPAGTPNYIRDGYDVTKLLFGEDSCLLVNPREKKWNLATLKKQIKTMERIIGEHVIIQLDRLTALQRTNLIREGIAFISGTGQMYVPFWGSYFEEKIANHQEPTDVMTANAQLIFLFLYYKSRENDDRINQTQIARALCMSKATCTRAIKLLCGLKLIKLMSEGTTNWISLNGKGDHIINEALKYMSTPIHKIIYVNEMPKDIPVKHSGMRALAEGTMLDILPGDRGYAVSREMAKNIDQSIIIEEQTFLDFGGQVIEVWKYDPSLLSENDRVDDISLFLEMKNDEDERVQYEIDRLRQKYGLTEGIINGSGD